MTEFCHLILFVTLAITCHTYGPVLQYTIHSYFVTGQLQELQEFHTARKGSKGNRIKIAVPQRELQSFRAWMDSQDLDSACTLHCSMIRVLNLQWVTKPFQCLAWLDLLACIWIRKNCKIMKILHNMLLLLPFHIIPWWFVILIFGFNT